MTQRASIKHQTRNDASAKLVQTRRSDAHRLPTVHQHRANIKLHHPIRQVAEVSAYTEQ